MGPNTKAKSSARPAFYFIKYTIIKTYTPYCTSMCTNIYCAEFENLKRLKQAI